MKVTYPRPLQKLVLVICVLQVLIDAGIIRVIGQCRSATRREGEEGGSLKVSSPLRPMNRGQGDMAGALQYRLYQDDRGLTWAIRGDKSNFSAVNGSVGLLTSSPPYSDGLPSNLKPRFLEYSSPLLPRKVVIVALTQAVYNSPPAQIADLLQPGGGVLLLTRKVPERRTIPGNVPSPLQP
jgi:hypothetical protein